MLEPRARQSYSYLPRCHVFPFPYFPQSSLEPTTPNLSISIFLVSRISKLLVIFFGALMMNGKVSKFKKKNL